MSSKVIFFGNERLVSGLKHTNAPVLSALIDHGYDVQAIISHHTASQSRSQRHLEVAEIGKKHNIPVLLPNRPAEIIDQIASYHAEIAVLVAYGRIIPQHVIDLFPKGIINLHPSLLPQYRGPTPIESAIENGDRTAGVSVMQLSAQMDAGPLYGQAKINLTGNETKFDLYQSLSQLGAKLILDLLPSIIDGSLQPYPQDNSKAIYCQLLTKQDALLDPTQYTAAQAERRIRAHLGFPKTKAYLLGHMVVITKSHVSSMQKSPLDLKCQDGAFLSIDELIAPSGKHMDAAAFLRGYAAA